MSQPRFVSAVLPVLLLSAALLQTGCWVTTDQGQAMEADIVKLKADTSETRSDAQAEAVKSQRDRDDLRAEQDAEISKVDAKIQEVNTALDGLRHTASKTGADLADQQSDDEKEIARLRGLIEETQAKNSALEQQLAQASATANLPDRVAALEKKLADDETKLAAFQQQAVAHQKLEQEEAALPVDKDDFYKLARKKLDAKDFDAARDLFTQFISRWKNDALTGSAQYWIADSYYQEKNYRKAGLEFQKVCDKYPKNEKAPEAELMVGTCFLNLDMKKDAVSFFQTVIDAYPKSSAAKKAKEKLEEIKRHHLGAGNK